MSGLDASGIRVVLCDIFGTAVDWYTGVGDQVSGIAREVGVPLDGGEFASAWRERYLPSMRRVNDGAQEWAYLDALHRASLDELLESYGHASRFDEPTRQRLVHAWHRLPAWPDTAEAVRRLRGRFTVGALSNGGFALLTELIKAESLPFDCVLSAELAREYKPGARAYRTAVDLLDVDVTQTLMVACHGWDIDGARAAGLHTAFVERPREKGPHAAADRGADVVSDITVTSLLELADTLGC